MAAPDLRTPTVLVCEDDPAMVRIFQFLLRQRGIAVKTTARGETVCKMAQRDKPDVILLDLMLPDMDGLSVLKDLKTEEATKGIPVIIVSGKEADNQIKQALENGAVDYVIKPFDPMELGTRLRDFLDAIIKPPEPMIDIPTTPSDKPATGGAIS